MTTGQLIEVNPPELRFPFELEKEISCSILLSNKTDDHIAFKVMTSSRDCIIWPNRDILLPRSTCKVEVTKFEQSEAPPDMQCEDLFVIKSIVTFPGATRDDLRPETVNPLIK
ncbi:vesicle-associated protein 1-1-like [Asparagus officinalis]|uniref:vesicle-associated protein 1-1-like n=1 Tax=Asparagus officinalis TaxID=4686 RepID=UPI00098E78B8|nr:vesicle-associated protein 1-1-like [Asparagus officinalis]XP_020251102.1 vesicle-associated protein 1-1-like [Asparagus officinalis]